MEELILKISKKEIVQELNIEISKDFKLETYKLAKKRYLLFNDKPIVKSKINEYLEFISDEFSTKGKYKTIIVVAETNDAFEKKELVYFDNVDTLVVFYLVNSDTGEVYMDDSWTFMLGLNYRKYVRSINKIITSQ